MSDRSQTPLTVGELLGRITVQELLAGLGFIALGIGSFGPWVTLGSLSASGVNGDGTITAVAAVVGLIGVLCSRYRAGIAIAAIAALAGLATAGYDLVHVAYRASKTTLFGVHLAHPGWGLFLAAVGASIAIVGLGMRANNRLRVIVPAVGLVACLGLVGTAVGYQTSSNNSQQASTRPPTHAATGTVGRGGILTAGEHCATGTVATQRGQSTVCALPAPPTSSNAEGPLNVTSVPGGSTKGIAPVSQVGPAPDQTGCGDAAGYTVGSDTSCGFGANVLLVAQEAYAKTHRLPAEITASSPVNGRTYDLDCSANAAQELECGDYPAGNAEVTLNLPLAKG
jgi:xanthosine utilization system XapX-like protein